MDKFDEKLYHLLSEYHPEHKEKKLSQKAKHRYMSMLSLYLTGVSVDTGWYSALTNRLMAVGLEHNHAHALASIRDDWELCDLEED